MDFSEICDKKKPAFRIDIRVLTTDGEYTCHTFIAFPPAVCLHKSLSIFQSVWRFTFIYFMT